MFVVDAVVVKGELAKLIVPWQILKNEIYCNNTKMIIRILIFIVHLAYSDFLLNEKKDKDK